MITVAASMDLWEPSPAAGAGGSLGGGVAVDTSVLGKPDSFDGSEAKWKDWRTIMRAYVSLVSPNLSQMLPEAEKSDAPVLQVALGP